MQTVRSWINTPHAGDVWFHGADLLEHLERYDVEHAAFNHKSDFDRSRQSRFVEQVSAYQPEAIADFEAILEQAAERSRRRNRSRISEDGDDLDVDAYIDALGSGRRDVWVDDIVLVERRADAVEIVFDAAVPWGNRHADWMRRRQMEAYRLALQCEQNGTPCRVVAAFSLRFRKDEMGGEAVNFHVAVKDYAEPIFPTLWGAFTDNATCNDMLNIVAETVVGTGRIGNGSCARFKADIANPTYILPELNTYMEMPL